MLMLSKVMLQQNELENWKVIDQEGGELQLTHRRGYAGVRHADSQAAALTAALCLWLSDRYKVAVDMVSLAN